MVALVIWGKEGTRVPAVEIMLNSRHVSDMIEKGDMPWRVSATDKKP